MFFYRNKDLSFLKLRLLHLSLGVECFCSKFGLVMYAHVLVHKDYCDMFYFVHNYGCSRLEKVAHNNVIVVMIGWHIVFFTTIFFPLFQVNSRVLQKHVSFTIKMFFL
jgi:hypothetical protein